MLVPVSSISIDEDAFEDFPEPLAISSIELEDAIILFDLTSDRDILKEDIPLE